MNGFSFVFFGTPDIAVASLEALSTRGMLPSLIITAPDKPQGRGLVLAPSPVRTWGDARGISVLTPTKLSDPEFLEEIAALGADAFVVVAYGKILPPALLAIPPKGTLNMHPSLLPKHRGPSPIESQILTEERGADVGVSVMLLDEEMDHGPVLAVRSTIPEVVAQWPLRASLLSPLLAREGGDLLADTLPRWVMGEVFPHEQEHQHATYCKKITKGDALLDLAADPVMNYRKVLAYDVWPRAYFIAEHKGTDERVIVTDAVLENGALVIRKVIPEGKKEMPYASFLRGR